MKETNEKIGIPRAHPEFKKARRQRFCELLRDAYKILSKDLNREERLTVKDLYQLIERGTANPPRGEE